MKNIARSLLLFLALTTLVGCTKSFSIKDPVKVILRFGTQLVEISDADTIDTLTAKITSMQYQRGEPLGRFGWDGSYWIRWYDINEKIIFDALVDANGMFYNDYRWNCTSGTIDTGYFDELFITQNP